MALCLASAARAAPPAGDYLVEVAGPEVEVWVPEGAFEDCESDAESSACMTTDLHTDALGLVSGTGMLSLHLVDVVDMDLPLDVTGKTGGSTKKPSAKLELVGVGTATLHDEDLGDLPVDATGKLKVTCKDPLPHLTELTCRGSFRLCLSAFGRRLCQGDRIEMFVAAAGGPWSLSLTLATDDKRKVTGTATTLLANGESEAFTVTGKYDARKDRSSLKLQKVDPASKDRVSWSNFVESLDAGTIDFKLANEAGKLKLVPPPTP